MSSYCVIVNNDTTICCGKMKCPYCHKDDTKVVDKRDLEESTRRRRECLNCKKRFTTYEKIELLNLTIIKKDNNREAYNRSKLIRGFQKACEKRPISQQDLEKAIDWVENKLKAINKKEIPASKIGELVMQKLKTLDKVAYIRFASVYKDFKDIDDFKKELKQIKR